ncbi:MAG: FemAB family PEP-CTERM system-associated protein [Candidatus Tectomicrobia bacterium]|nr:FemAB family PEP-CTERM system-associated protein [Candidatus Tectomicrobia bacterium]
MECRWLVGGDAEDKRWDEYVMQHPLAHHYHLSAWGQVIEQAYGHRAVYLMAEDAGATTGVLPLIKMNSWVLGKVLSSLPFADYGGICADDAATRAELLHAALAYCEQIKAKTLDLRHCDPSGLGLRTFDDKVTLRLPLQADAERMWEGFHAKVRNQVRKAIKSDLVVHWVGEEGLRAFYRVWAANMRDLGSPVHSLRFFRAVFAAFPSTRLVLIATPQEVIGGALCLYFRHTVSVPWASSLRAFFRYCPNNLLYWEVIRAACEAGYRTFDFGRSSYGSGAYNFKKQWGAVEHRLSWEYWSRHAEAQPIVQAEGGSSYRAAMALWRNLPLSLTTLIGPHIRRHLSN